MFTSIDTGMRKPAVIIIPDIKQRPNAVYLFLLSRWGMV
jgi:hypothetical protein